MPILYLAGAIDRSVETAWRKRIKAELADVWDIMQREGTLIIYDPFSAFDAVGREHLTEDCRNLVLINTQAIKQSDVMLLKYTPGEETWGTAMEVVMAANIANIPIVVWTEEEFLEGVVSATADGFLPMYLQAFAYDGECAIGANSAATKAVLALREDAERNERDTILDTLKSYLRASQ